MQCKPVDPGLTRLISPDSVDKGLQADDDTNDGKITSFPVPSIFGLACAFACTSCHAYTPFIGEVQCEDTLFEPSQVCQTQTIFGIEGDTIDVDFMVVFWMGLEWTKGYLVQAQLPHLENQKTTPCRGPMSVWAVQT